MYKFMHGILPTKFRLFQIKQSTSPLCDWCNIVEDNLHMFGNCQKVQALFGYFLDVLKKVCNIGNVNIQNLLYLDTQNIGRQKRNTQVVLISKLYQPYGIIGIQNYTLIHHFLEKTAQILILLAGPSGQHCRYYGVVDVSVQSVFWCSQCTGEVDI